MKTLAVPLFLAASSVAICAACESRVSVALLATAYPASPQLLAKEKDSKPAAPAPTSPAPSRRKSPPPREQKPAPPAVLFM